jgi:hypothetical protein
MSEIAIIEYVRVLLRDDCEHDRLVVALDDPTNGRHADCFPC